MLSRNTALALLSAASSATLAMGMPAAAQTASPAAAGSELQEVVVTARRKDESLQRVPVAASALSADVLARRQVNNAIDLQYVAPSLVIATDPLGGSSAPVFQLRGQTSPLGTDPTVVEYFADVPVDPRVIASGIFDLTSVQVIRGPQGTLFGKNSTGGAVLFTPQKASTSDSSGFIDAGVGNYDLHQVTGAVNMPLVKDVLALRLSGTITRQDGFVRNLSGPDADDKHYEGGRASLVYESASFNNDLLASYFHGDQQMKPAIMTGIGFIAAIPAALASFERQQALGPRTIDMSGDRTRDRNTSYLISNVSTYHFNNGVSLKNIIGYYNANVVTHFNQPSVEFSIIDVAQNRNQHQLSDELQLAGTSANNALTWITGAFYSRAVTTFDQATLLFGNAFQPEQFSYTSDEYVSKAVFGQASYDISNLGLQGVKLTGGLRYTWDRRTGSEPPNVPTPMHLQNKKLSWTVGIDYQATSNTLLYIASRHSYKAGGFNLVGGNTPAVFNTYLPETLTDLEVGAKTTFHLADMPVRTNIALYKGWYNNMQVQAVGRCPNVASLITNAASGDPRGIELEVQARPTGRLQVSGFYDLTLGNFNRFVIPHRDVCDFGGIPDVSGQSFGNISKHTLGLTADYTIPLGSGDEEIVLDGNLYYRSAQIGNGLRNFSSHVPAYTLLNFRVDYNNIGGRPVSLGAYVRNATNKLYAVSRDSVIATSGYDVSFYGDPRTYGVELRYKF
jgi:iron complex outermembrane receptor protein